MTHAPKRPFLQFTPLVRPPTLETCAASIPPPSDSGNMVLPTSVQCGHLMIRMGGAVIFAVIWNVLRGVERELAFVSQCVVLVIYYVLVVADARRQHVSPVRSNFVVRVCHLVLNGACTMVVQYFMGRGGISTDHPTPDDSWGVAIGYAFQQCKPDAFDPNHCFNPRSLHFWNTIASVLLCFVILVADRCRKPYQAVPLNESVALNEHISRKKSNKPRKPSIKHTTTRPVTHAIDIDMYTHDAFASQLFRNH